MWQPSKYVFVTLLYLSRKYLLKVTSKCHKHQHWKFHPFFFLEDYFTSGLHESALKTGKLSSSAFSLLLWKASSLNCEWCRLCLHASRTGSLVSSWCCSCTRVVFASMCHKPCWPSAAIPSPSCRPMQRLGRFHTHRNYLFWVKKPTTLQVT